MLKTKHEECSTSLNLSRTEISKLEIDIVERFDALSNFTSEKSQNQKNTVEILNLKTEIISMKSTFDQLKVKYHHALSNERSIKIVSFILRKQLNNHNNLSWRRARTVPHGSTPAQG